MSLPVVLLLAAGAVSVTGRLFRLIDRIEGRRR